MVSAWGRYRLVTLMLFRACIYKLRSCALGRWPALRRRRDFEHASSCVASHSRRINTRKQQRPRAQQHTIRAAEAPCQKPGKTPTAHTCPSCGMNHPSPWSRKTARCQQHRQAASQRTTPAGDETSLWGLGSSPHAPPSLARLHNPQQQRWNGKAAASPEHHWRQHGPDHVAGPRTPKLTNRETHMATDHATHTGMGISHPRGPRTC